MAPEQSVLSVPQCAGVSSHAVEAQPQSKSLQGGAGFG